MKRLIVFICALAISLLAGCVPVFAASLPHYSCYYPVSVEETIGGNCEDCRIVKVYQMGANADPSGIPTEDFERYGCTYHLLDITRRDEIGIAKMPWTKPVSESCETSNPQEAAAKFQQEIEVSTEDGYSGTLRLDRDSVQVEADGYATKKQEITSMRTYSNLSAANPALLPQTIEENGNILSLGDVEWTEAWQTESAGAALRYSASASYKGTVDIPYATGYHVTANYTGEVVKLDSEVATYTVVFQAVSAEPEPEPEPEPEAEPEPVVDQQAVQETDPAMEPDAQASSETEDEPGGGDSARQEETANEKTDADEESDREEVEPVRTEKKRPIALVAVGAALVTGGVVLFRKIRNR